MKIGKAIGLQLGPPTRNAFGEALCELGKSNSNLVVVDGDVGNSTRTQYFGDQYPKRFFNAGIAESNMVGIASGMAATGKEPVVASFACFLLCNAYDQIRMGVAFPQLNVKLVGSHSGISIGEDGPSQMAIEDIALATSLPHMTVLVPADAPSTAVATRLMFQHQGPVYLRTGRPEVPIVYNDEAFLESYQIGRANQLSEGSDVTIVACGLLVAAALEATHQLREENITARVLDMHTI
ncbi:MAG: transketolase family protein, partial [Caldilineaceae bacterium]|nr:transketolase family protein [Caldilineaceae bacterium]